MWVPSMSFRFLVPNISSEAVTRVYSLPVAATLWEIRANSAGYRHHAHTVPPAQVGDVASPPCDVERHRGQVNPYGSSSEGFRHPLVAHAGVDRGLLAQLTVLGDDPDVGVVYVEAEPGAHLCSVDTEVQHFIAVAQADRK